MRLTEKSMLSIGLISMTLGILIGQFATFEYLEVSVSAFASGVLLGLSLVMNFAYLVRRRRTLAQPKRQSL
jgi:hypothetical protein